MATFKKIVVQMSHGAKRLIEIGLMAQIKTCHLSKSEGYGKVSCSNSPRKEGQVLSYSHLQ